MDQKWLMMGVELEGAWDTSPGYVLKLAKGAEERRDGSVRDMEGVCGEIVTRPHEKLENLIKDVTVLYPKRVNTTCGLHIHASFDPMSYSSLADKTFWAYYRERWTAWGKANDDAMGPGISKYYWQRFDGRWRAENPDRGSGERKNFCKAEFKPVDQLGPNQEDRYTQLNFVAWHKYKTLESRQLPMFNTPDLAVSAIQELSDIYNSYLTEYKFPKVSIYKEWKGVGDVFIDETIIPTPDFSPLSDTKMMPHPSLVTGPDIEYAIEGAEDMMLPLVKQMRTPHL